MFIVLAAFLFGGVSGFHIRLSEGIISGYTTPHGSEQVHVFKGIPFAKPPIGDLRFRFPKPMDNWSGIRPTVKYSAPCMSDSNRTTSPQSNVSEDCLYLNVFADKRCWNRLCPVLFYIHGGGFYYDSAVMFNDTEIINKYASDEIVFVIPAFRLGVFGFLDLGKPLDDAPYNVGFHDLIFALKWFKKVAKKFGGDPKQITVVGNSGGALAVEYLLVTPFIAPKTFQRAVILSGVPQLYPHLNAKMSRLTTDGIGCLRNSNGTELSLQSQLECLKEANAAEISKSTRASENIWTKSGPQTDDLLFPEKSYYRLAKKYFKPMPILISTTTEEMVLDRRNRTLEQICALYFPTFGYQHHQTAQQCAQYYSRNNSDLVDRDVMRAFSMQLARENTAKKEPTYLEIFAQKNHSKHANDLIYFFGLHPIANKTIGDKLMDKFYPNTIKQFVRGYPPLSDWKPIDSKGRNYYFLDFEEKISPHFVSGEIYDEKAVNFWLEDLAETERRSSLRIPNQLFATQQQQNGQMINWTLIFSLILLFVFLLFFAFGLRYRKSAQRGEEERANILGDSVRKYV